MVQASLGDFDLSKAEKNGLASSELKFYVPSVLALLVHLFVTAFVFPFIGTLFFAGFVIAGDARFFVSDVGILFFILPILAGFAPFLGWVTFVPLGCLTFLFFRATASTHARGAGFWVVAWALIGAGTGAAYAFVTSRHGFELARLVCSGLAAGLVLARLHRRVWIGLYPEADPRFRMPESPESSRPS